MFLDYWTCHEWVTFGLCVTLGCAWILYAWAIWVSAHQPTDFDRRHDALDEEE